jgi:hypothetical protein
VFERESGVAGKTAKKRMVVNELLTPCPGVADTVNNLVTQCLRLVDVSVGRSLAR